MVLTLSWMRVSQSGMPGFGISLYRRATRRKSNASIDANMSISLSDQPPFCFAQCGEYGLIIQSPRLTVTASIKLYFQRLALLIELCPLRIAKKNLGNELLSVR